MQKLDENGDPQWIDENDPALPGIQLTEDLVRREGMRCISDGEGGAIAVWSDERNRAFDIYAHRLNADGETADGWPEENLVINSAGSNQFGHSIISDGTGGVIIAWISGQRNGGNIYANKLDADGNLIWDDDPEGGVEIRLSERNNSYLSLCSDGSGGAFVSWTGYRENQEDSDIFCQRILEDGTIPWSDNGEIICDAPGDQNYSGIVSVEQGQAVIVWEHEVDNSNSDLYMQKIAGEDSILLHWEPEGEDRDGLTLCNDQLEQCDPSLAPDGEGGFIAAWYDERLGGSVPGDIYAQRVDSDARRIWLNGHDVLVTNARLKQTSPSLHVFNETVKTVWCDYRSGSPGIYTQFLEIAGGIAILDEDCEEIVSGKGYDGRHPRISIDGENLWFAWNDQRLGEMGEYIFIQRADLTEGAFAFGDEARMIIAPDFEEDDPIVMDSVAVAADGNGGIYLAWQENRYDHYFNIRTQLVNSNGQILWGDTGKSPTSDGRNVEYNRDLSKPRLLVTENGRLYVAFHKYIGHNYWQNVLIQRMSRGGEPMWTEEEHNALLVTNSELDHTVEGMTYFEDGSILLVIMRITGPSDYDLIAQRISSNGVLLW
ncbi:MAG: hypothetical protein RAP03_13530, partial [Candidatus Electryonea clarkiae]|nr:hypothetical protein [Candidatus Electryonea clarkiae]